MLTFGSLFAGIGGFDLGFERAGMVCKWQVEIDDYATKVLQKHWPQVHRESDIRQCGKHNLEPVDIICGGFPCQDISYAGLGAGLEGERSGLFFEAVRVVRELRPQIVVLENVAALLTRGLDRVLGTLAEIGFDAEWHCIPAAAVGAPHIRDRAFVVAYSDTNGWRFKECQKQHSEKEANSANRNTRRGHADRLRDKTPRAICNSTGSRLANRAKVAMGKPRTLAKPERPMWWQIEPAVGRVADGIPHRVDRLRGLGNAVVPQVAEWIGRRIVEATQCEKCEVAT